MIALSVVLLAAGLLALPGHGVALIRLRRVHGTPAPPWWMALVRGRGRAAVRGRGGDDAEPLRLAAAWDLLAAALRAGMPVPEAMRAVSGGLPEEAAVALRSSGELIALGADPEQAWEPALQCAATTALARAARRTARSGTALAGAAAVLAERLRAELAEQVEAKAQRAGVLITGPLGLCFLPGFLCLGVVPVVIGLAGQLTVMR